MSTGQALSTGQEGLEELEILCLLYFSIEMFSEKCFRDLLRCENLQVFICGVHYNSPPPIAEKLVPFNNVLLIVVLEQLQVNIRVSHGLRISWNDLSPLSIQSCLNCSEGWKILKEGNSVRF